MPRCPVCKSSTEMIKYEGVPVHNCGSCGGSWVTGAKLSRIVTQREIEMPEAVQEKMIEIANEANSTEPLYCMGCGKRMVKEQFRHWSDIELDRCPKCNGIWLDRGELEKCQIYWERLQDNPDSEDAKRIEKMAMLDSRWSVRQARLRDKIDRLGQPRHFGDRDADLLADLFNLDEGLDPAEDC